MTEATQATDENETTITIAYTDMSLERGTDAEKDAYRLRSADLSPDELDEDEIDAVYDSRVSFDVTIDPGLETIELLEQVYHGVSRDMIEQVDRSEYRSPMIGDVFVVDGDPHVVARVGFEKIETSADVFEPDE